MQNSLFQKPLSSVTQKLIFRNCSSSVFLWHTGEHYVQFITLVVFFLLRLQNNLFMLVPCGSMFLLRFRPLYIQHDRFFFQHNSFYFEWLQQTTKLSRPLKTNMTQKIKENPCVIPFKTSILRTGDKLSTSVLHTTPG